MPQSGSATREIPSCSPPASRSSRMSRSERSTSRPRDSSPSQAAEKANVFAEETLGFLGEQAAATQQDEIQRANEQLDKLQADIDDLETQIDAATAAGQSVDTLKARRDSLLRQYGAAFDQQQNVLDQPPPSAGYITLQPALPELAKQEAGGFSAPSSRPARTALAVIVGLLLGLGVILLAERLDTRIHDVGAASGAFGLPVIAEVPKVTTKKADRHIVSALEPMSALAESYRTPAVGARPQPDHRARADPSRSGQVH